ncbi:MAG: UDP-N-acetylglucosamine 1-carboxyvinyltransferase [Xanthomonadaceae bacterium]|nr:UDP-N-acetylglucosamine 1-carboxyvinyltransferase [Rhodospirillaceae bacterium]NIA17781.1 UDP-N-acetylglucosamine 1-carboxyvinyltransferase [Xanthomonadaceae bacterium]
MKQYIIKGGNKLSGEIKVKGAKNSALKIIASTILTKGENKISNVPQINDIKKMMDILKDLGVNIKKNQSGSFLINTDNISKTDIDEKKGKDLRASIILSGPLLARFKKATIPYPGGCLIGKRPIDIFINGLQSLGAHCEEKNNKYYFTTKQLHGAIFVFPKISVTATETMIMAASIAEGTTVLKNTAQEPEIIELAKYLNKCGAKIKGAGTSIITIKGVKRLLANKTKIMPDRIEVGTFVIMGLLTKSAIKISNCLPEHLETFLLMIKKAGGKLEIGKNFIKTLPTKKFNPVNIITHEYPGFATDLQAPFTLLMTQAEGNSLIHDPIFNGRLFFTDKLNQMGADIIMCDPHRAIVKGPTHLFGKNVDSPDLRAGITLVLAGLIAQGTTTIGNTYQIERGYENIIQRLKNLGAKIYAK